MLENFSTIVGYCDDLSIFLFFLFVSNFIKNFVCSIIFFAFFGLSKKNDDLDKIWILLKLSSSWAEKVFIAFFLFNFAIPNKIIVYNKWGFFVGSGVTSFLSFGTLFHPFFYLPLIDISILVFESFFFGILYEKTVIFPKFINTFLFPSSELRVLLFRFFFGNMFKAPMKWVGGAAVPAVGRLQYESEEHAIERAGKDSIERMTKHATGPFTPEDISTCYNKGKDAAKKDQMIHGLSESVKEQINKKFTAKPKELSTEEVNDAFVRGLKQVGEKQATENLCKSLEKINKGVVTGEHDKSEIARKATSLMDEIHKHFPKD